MSDETESGNIISADRLIQPSGKQGGYQPLTSLSKEEILAQTGAAGVTQEKIPGKNLGSEINTLKTEPIKISGVADPAFASNKFSLGDTVYSKTLQGEGVVKDITAKGRVKLQMTTGPKKGVTGWAETKNCIKIG